MTSFTPYTPKKPAVVDRLDITLTCQMEGDENGEPTRGKTIKYQVSLHDEDGHLVRHPFGDDHGNLAPFMTAAQIAAAEAFLEAMYTKAQKLIP